MNSPRQQKIFMARLLEEKTLPFTQVIEILAPEKPAKTIEVVSEALNFLWVENLFAVKAKGSEEEIWINDDMFLNPDNYYLEFVSMEGKDTIGSKPYKGKICEDDIQVRSAQYITAGIQARELLTIVGEKNNATLLAERIRAFTHYFAFRVTARDFHAVEKCSATVVEAKFSARYFAEKIQHIESTYGSIDFFDHVTVISVYSGRHAQLDEKSMMNLPEGLTREQRRGEASFKLVTVYTPNGVAIHSYTVTIGIIEEQGGLLKISHIEWHAD